MEYAKLQLNITRSVFWRLASTSARGAAISILAYCADQENRGRLEGAATWTDAAWGAAASITRAEAHEAIQAGLCSVDAGDVVCHLYDQRGHDRLTVQRQQGAHGVKGGRKSTDGDGTLRVNPKGLPHPEPPSTHPPIHPSSERETTSAPAPSELTMEQETLKALVLDYRAEVAGEWSDLALMAGVKTQTEACAFIRWAAIRARKAGMVSPYPRQLADLAPAWRESPARLRLMKPQPPKEDHGSK